MSNILGKPDICQDCQHIGNPLANHPCFACSQNPDAKLVSAYIKIVEEGEP